MKTQDRLNFIKLKIEELQTAVLHNCSNRILTVPSGVVKTLQVDATGCIWFSIAKPLQHIAEFDLRFPVEMDYYQKGCPFYLNIKGMARLVIDPEEINSLPSDLINGLEPGKVFTCVKITSANYHERNSSTDRNLMRQLKDYINSFFQPHNLYVNFEQSAI